jgi:hypothetical protein
MVKKKNLIFLGLLFSSGFLFAQENQLISYFGVFRSTLHNSRLNGNLMDNDSSSVKRGSYGRSFFDLGIKIQPDKSFKAHAILRAETNMGEGNAGGLALIFRQIRAEGSISKMVKYEVGDIDVGLTKYTMYNNEEIFNEFESDIFKTRRNILAYDNFNIDNKWRVQGLQANAGVRIGNAIEKVGLHIFAARVRRANMISIPDRLVVGGKVDLKQSKYFRLGINWVSMFDNQGSTVDTVINFKNNVLTSDFEITPLTNDKLDVGLSGELGISDSYYFVENQNRAATLNDYFYDAGIFALIKSINLRVKGSYRNVGPDFFSPTSQTLRIMANGEPSVFGKVMNDSISRAPNLFDRMTDLQLYNQRIGTTLMPFLPIYGNVQPYGQATPNRKGPSIELSKSDSADILYVSLKTDLLSEIIGEGAPELRKFSSIQGGARFRLGSLFSFEKELALTAGARYESTKRSGVAPVDFSTIIIDGGIMVETLKNIDLLMGAKYLIGSGNEAYAVRNDFKEIIGFTDYIIDQNQLLLSPSCRFRFGKYSYARLDYNRILINDLKNKGNSYSFGQLFVNFSLIF